MFVSRLKCFLGGCLISSLFLPLYSHSQPETRINSVIAQAESARIGESKGWLALLHMRKNIWGNWKSEASDHYFLLSGRRDDPAAELTATLKSFFESDGRCRFPARFLYLNRLLHFSSVKNVTDGCPGYKKFHDGIDAHSVSVVFSSYFLNNPSSAFGHTFFRLSREKPQPSKLEIDKTGRYELLDYGVGYAANTTTHNPILYAFMGLFGFFQGSWTSVPYYYKVREYNDFDSRDLWSYTLNLSQDEVEMLVAHLWELGHTSFDYFYFTRNCSYEIIATLEAAKPDLDLVENLHSQVIPSDTIQAIYKYPGLVTNVTYRPSIRSQLFARLRTLSSKDQRLVKQILERRTLAVLPAELPPQERADVLDAAIDGADFQNPKDLVSDKDRDSFKDVLLQARSQVPVTTQEADVRPLPYDRPHLGHGSHRVGAFEGVGRENKSFTQLNYRFAHHDFSDPVTGYPGYASIEFFSAQGRYNEIDHSVWLEDLTIFHVVSLSTANGFSVPFSWEVKVGAETVRDGRCQNCAAAEGQFGGGYSVALGDQMIASLLLEGQSMGSGHFTGGLLQFSAGPRARLVMRLGDKAQAVFSSTYFENFRRDYKYSFVNEMQAQWNLSSALGLRLVFKNLSSEVATGENELSLGGVYYF